MATLYSDNATTQNAALTNSPGYVKDGAQITGAIRYAIGTYTSTGSEAAADVINFVRLPKGATVIPHLSEIENQGALSGTFTLNVGDADEDGTTLDADRYVSAANLASAGRVAFTESTTAALTPYKTVGPTWITGTIATLATPVAAKKLVCRVAYAVPA